MSIQPPFKGRQGCGTSYGWWYVIPQRNRVGIKEKKRIILRTLTDILRKVAGDFRCPRILSLLHAELSYVTGSGKTLRMGFFAKTAIAVFINSTTLELTLLQA